MTKDDIDRIYPGKRLAACPHATSQTGDGNIRTFNEVIVMLFIRPQLVRFLNDEEIEADGIAVCRECQREDHLDYLTRPWAYSLNTFIGHREMLN